MKRFESLRITCNNVTLPDDMIILQYLDAAGYSLYLPTTFLADMLIIGRAILLRQSLPDDEYVLGITSLLDSFKITFLVEDVINILIELGKRYDLRKFESVARKQLNSSNLLDVHDKTFNYPFNIDDLTDDIVELLNITEEQLNELEEMPEEVIQVLTIANNYGVFMNAKNVFHNTTAVSMDSYGDILKIKKFKYADPLFEYKFATKAYDIQEEVEAEIHADTMIIGYFINSFGNGRRFRVLIKLLGVLALQFKGGKIIVYEFISENISKYEMTNKQEIIKFFKSPKQLGLYQVPNDAMLRTMTFDNPGSEIVFLPNIKSTLTFNSFDLKGCTINIISQDESKHNKKFADICALTNGKFITV